jgi:predicted Fe-Mo cluster-binding NifX family protein
MTRKIGIPLFGNRVSSRLDCSESILLVAIDDGTIIQRQEMRWTHASILERIHLLLEEGVAILICGGLTETCAHLLRDSNIEVIPWVRGEVEEVLVRFMQGTLRTIVGGGNIGRSTS